jgi:hypothetical protein
MPNRTNGPEFFTRALQAATKCARFRPQRPGNSRCACPQNLESGEDMPLTQSFCIADDSRSDLPISWVVSAMTIYDRNRQLHSELPSLF